MNDYNFGNHIYELRVKRGLTQKDVALSLGISDKAVSKWENGTAKPTIRNLKKLAEKFDVTLEELLHTKKRKKISQITKIVITGGPSSGKTTCIKKAAKYFENAGYKVIIITDLKDTLKECGVCSSNVTDYLKYQEFLLKSRLQLEDFFDDYINNLNDPKILLLYDEGSLDFMAHNSKKDVQMICNNLEITPVELRNSYDAVFHLKSVAKLNKEYYQKISKNKDIDADYALALDDKIILSWISHANYRIIDCFSSIETKSQKLIHEISKFLNEDSNSYIEKKFLIKRPNLEVLDNLKVSSKVRMVLTYLNNSSQETDFKLLHRKEENKNFYQKITKGPVGKITIYISPDEYIEELNNADKSRHSIIKDRYSFVYQSMYYKIDIFNDWEEEAILEIDILQENDEIVIPKFIDVIKDVSNDGNYKNYNLARN